MSNRSQKYVGWVAAAIVVAMLSATSVIARPAKEQATGGVGVAAVTNADRVDGKHAVGAGTSPTSRAGKLVATNSLGLLPSDIIRPLWSLLQGVPGTLADGLITWDEVTGKPPGFADNVDNGAFTSSIIADVTVPLAGGGVQYVAYGPISRNIDVQFSVIPGTVGPQLAIEEVRVARFADGSLGYYVKVTNRSLTSSVFKVRAMAFADGIALAALKSALKSAHATVTKKRPR